MFFRVIKPATKWPYKDGVRHFSVTSQTHFKVAVAGASGGIGQPLSLLLKLNSLITHLALYDISKVTPGVAVDVSHVTTKSKVTGHKGPEQIGEAFKDTNLVVVPAGMARKPGMKRDDLFAANASVVRDIAEAFAKHAPKTSVLAIITNPVNSMLPIACEVLKKHKVFDPARVLGVTTLDIVRASTFIGEINCIDPAEVYIPVVGGHSGITIVPVLSQAKPPVNLKTEDEIKKLISKIQEAGTTVLNAKAGGGTATLAMAYAGARFACSVLRGIAGESNVVECAMVQSDVSEAKYFANPVVLGKKGMECNLGYGTLNELETCLLKKAMPTLLKNIKTGEDFVNKKSDSDKCK